jgi:hypothetical protein
MTRKDQRIWKAKITPLRLRPRIDKPAHDWYKLWLTRYDQPYEDRDFAQEIETLDRRLIHAAATLNLCRMSDGPSTAGQAVITWLCSAKGISPREASYDTTVEAAIDILTKHARESASRSSSSPKPRRTTKPRTGRTDIECMLIAALTKHHNYSNGELLNHEPIGNNELAKLAGVAKSSASAFFKKRFHGHSRYKIVCRDKERLIAKLTNLNDENSQTTLFNPDQLPDRKRRDER